MTRKDCNTRQWQKEHKGTVARRNNREVAPRAHTRSILGSNPTAERNLPTKTRTVVSLPVAGRFQYFTLPHLFRTASARTARPPRGMRGIRAESYESPILVLAVLAQS